MILRFILKGDEIVCAAMKVAGVRRGNPENRPGVANPVEHAKIRT
jgi:hypothetical protein